MLETKDNFCLLGRKQKSDKYIKENTNNRVFISAWQNQKGREIIKGKCSSSVIIYWHLWKTSKHEWKGGICQYL